MKYIIDVPDDLYVMNGELHIPWRFGENPTINWLNTGIKSEPYTEPDRKAIEDAVWEITRLITLESHDGGLNPDELYECFGRSSIQDVMRTHSYQEAKAKYEAWKKQKDEIRVGDEVVYDTERYNYEAKAVVLRPETDDKYAAILALHNLNRITASKDELRKTGRHFDEVAELLKKMGEG